MKRERDSPESAFESLITRRLEQMTRPPFVAFSATLLPYDNDPMVAWKFTGKSKDGRLCEAEVATSVILLGDNVGDLDVDTFLDTIVKHWRSLPGWVDPD